MNIQLIKSNQTMYQTFKYITDKILVNVLQRTLNVYLNNLVNYTM